MEYVNIQEEQLIKALLRVLRNNNLDTGADAGTDAGTDTNTNTGAGANTNTLPLGWWSRWIDTKTNTNSKPNTWYQNTWDIIRHTCHVLYSIFRAIFRKLWKIIKILFKIIKVLFGIINFILRFILNWGRFLLMIPVIWIGYNIAHSLGILPPEVERVAMRIMDNTIVKKIIEFMEYIWSKISQ
jgi:hypothetical protein